MTPYLQNKTLYPPLIHKSPSINLGIIVVIPCYEEPMLQLTLMSLKKCTLPNKDVEVIIIINDGQNASASVVENNLQTYQQTKRWASENSKNRLRFYVLYKDGLPSKHAGVGLARKIGMDEASFRFESIRNKRGVILCFDADSRCEKNYFVAVENYFNQFPKCQAASIHFEHPLVGIDYEEEVYEAIILYELHLRYYILAKKWAGFIFANHTIGSSMAVRCNAYQKQGGMNRRKAGEDFYFLHKFTPLGNFGNITTTTVKPSPRPSHRVPFGTGKAVNSIITQQTSFETYHPESFIILRLFLKKVTTLFTLSQIDILGLLNELPISLQGFLKSIDFLNKVAELQANTTNQKSFKNRFFRWFNAFMIMKYLHYQREHHFNNVDIVNAARWLLLEYGINIKEGETAKQILKIYRKIDKGEMKISLNRTDSMENWRHIEQSNER